MASQRPFAELHDNATAALVNVTRTAGQIAKEDLGFLKVSTPRLAKALSKQNGRLLSLARTLSRSASDGTDLHPPELSRTESVDDEWRRVVDVLDSLLEKADMCLDEFTGVIKKQVSEQDTPNGSRNTGGYSAKPNLNRNIPKPQLFFKNVPRNDKTTPFKPLLRSKPHATVPLEASVTSETLPDEHKHPYEAEIQQSNYPSSIYNQAEPTPPLPFEGTSATYVDTLEGVHDMLSELKEAREIAVDLEHHDTRSYVGIVSLMQISTREKDWIIDTLKPWREELQILNEVFADPSIVKVFHGAAMDIVWLQRDLGLYVVGLFDTFHAASELRYPKRSLAFLLQKFVNFDAQKQYQLADWRIRPLTKEMFDYARSDTHFLLYVFDNMRNELLASSEHPGELINTVVEESKKVALQKYERSLYDSDLGMGSSGWYNMLIKQSAIFTKEQFSVFKAVHQWRDEIARKEDESVQFVMQNSSLYNLAREMPSAIPQLLGCLPRVSDPARKRLSELLGVIAKARANGVNGPEMKDVLREHPATIKFEAWKASKRQESQPIKQPTLAEIAKRELLNLSSDELKAEASLFWGSTVNGNKRQKLNGSADIQHPAYCLQIPLPHLTAEIFATNGEGQVSTSKHRALPEHPYIKERGVPQDSLTNDVEVFTIKETSGPRKRKLEDRNLGALSKGRHDSHGEVQEIKLDQRSPKAKRKAKRGRKGKGGKGKVTASNELDGGNESGGSSEGGQFEPDSDPEDPFDYTTAPSVLHAKPAPGDKTRAPVFDPYRKAMDAPRGLGRTRKEIAGKSATFKK